jgi:peptidoglycan/xylan/chitin deacetylase (PgdA/CDA1 family)
VRPLLALAAVAVALSLAPAAGGASPRLPPQLARLAALGYPVYCGGAAGREVALTFDDGPGPYTERLLAILRHERVPATFFLVGNRVAYWPKLPREEAALGSVGNHTWSHPHLGALRPAEVARELLLAQRAIEAAAGRAPVFFRPPYDDHPPLVDRVAQRLGLLEVLYSVDSEDSIRGGTTPNAVLRRLEPRLRPGAIVLLHDLHPWTLRVVPRLVSILRHRRLRPVTVTQLLAHDPPSVEQLQADARGRSCVEFPYVAPGSARS